MVAPVKPEHLQRCQVATPPDVVDLLWRLALAARKGAEFDSVLDLGAGDARFARSAVARFDRYLGVERDRHKITVTSDLPKRARVVCGDALAWRGHRVSLAIGNPPFIKAAHLHPEWRASALDRLEAQSGVRLKDTANAYVLFLLQAMLRTRDDGLVVQLVPYEWVSRPSAAELRAYLRAQRWDVRVFRFNADLFPRVLTTASVVIIDKRSTQGRWEFGEIERNGTLRTFTSPSGTAKSVLPYAGRDGNVHALRGLSPGGQEIFVLTEQQRLHFGLRKKRDVVPCVTSLRRLTADTGVLDGETFRRDFVESGARCWLIRSDRPNWSAQLSAYLASVGTRWKRYSTCTNRSQWARYVSHPAPALLVSSGFVGKAPKVVVNEVGAIAVGSVYAVLTRRSKPKLVQLACRLRAYDFSRRLVHHSNNLRKIEVRQLNAVLQRVGD